MKSLITILFSILLFSSCENICSDIENQLNDCKASLTDTQTQLAVSKTDLQNVNGLLGKTIKEFDTCRTEKALLELNLQSYKKEIVFQKNYYQNLLAEKASELNECQEDLNRCKEENQQNTQNNYLTSKGYAASLVDNIQSSINTSEQAYLQLLSIEDKAPEVLEAMRVTAETLHFYYGQRELIGSLFEIQVQSGIIDTNH